MTNSLDTKLIAFLVAPEGVEQVELTEPWAAVTGHGGQARLISTRSGSIQAFNHLDKADLFHADATTHFASADHFDGLVLPGGVANPDILRTDESAVEFVRGFFEAGKPVAAICHGPWTLIEAGVLPARTLTSWPSLRTDITNAGGTWVDRDVVRCDAGPNVLVSSRKPADLDAFCAATVQALSGGPGGPGGPGAPGG